MSQEPAEGKEDKPFLSVQEGSERWENLPGVRALWIAEGTAEGFTVNRGQCTR